MRAPSPSLRFARPDTAGLKVGDPAARVTELYPDATLPGDGSGDITVVGASSAVGDGGDISIIEARVRGSVVTGFNVYVGDAGQ